MELKTYFAQDRNGNLIPSANVAIYLTGTTTLATGLKNVSGENLPNPFNANADGKIQFYAPDGIYDMQVSLGSTTGVKVTFQCIDVQEQLTSANSAADRAEAAAETAEAAIDGMIKITDLGSGDGFQFIGQSSSFAELKTIVPKSAGQKILLASYYEGGGEGGGEFVAHSTVGLQSAPADNGGTIAVVNSTWYWERVQKTNLTVEAFGAIPYVVPEDHSIPANAVDSTDAWQRMYDSLRYAYASDRGGIAYLVNGTIILSGNYSHINIKRAFLTKNAPVKSGLPEYIPVGAGGYAPGNIACFFMTGNESVRYFTIEGGYLDAHLSPEGERPVAVYLPQAVNYRLINIQSRGCKHIVWAKSAWRGTLKDLRGNDSTGTDFWFDGSRNDSSGGPAANFQSATSLDISGLYSNNAGGHGYFFDGVDYSNVTALACDGAREAAYRFHNSQMSGSIGAENPYKEYLHASGSNLILYASFYDDGAVPTSESYPVATVDSGSALTLMGNFRTQHNKLMNVLGSGATAKVTQIATWNGINTNIPPSTCESGSFLEVFKGRLGNSHMAWANGIAQEVRLLSPDYNTAPSSLSPYIGKIARFGMSAPGTVMTIPLYRIKEIFPNFNRNTGGLVEYIKTKVTNGNGVAYGAVFAVVNGALVGTNVVDQKTVGNGSAAAVISAITISGNNLEITFTGSVGAGTVVELSYL